MTKKPSYQQILFNQVNIPEKLLTSYKNLGLNEYDVMIILQIYRLLQANVELPSPAEIATYLTISETECAEHLKRLFQKNMLEIKEYRNENNQISETYSLEPLWEKLFTSERKEQVEHEGTIFILFEQEFGRPLSPFEIETINVWLDEDRMSPALIKAALRESVLMGKLNFKYIDRILREWKHKGIQSVEQARAESQSFRKNRVQKQYKVEKRDTSVYYNWLNNGGE